MSLKTRTAKYRKFDQLKQSWSEKYEGSSVVIQGRIYKVYRVWIQGITYKSIFGIKFKTDAGWISVWDGMGRRPSVNKIKVI